MSGTCVVCWMNRKEWLDIYQCLYNFNSPKLQRKGLDRVLAWNSRSGGKLPLAIESTADLVLAHLNDAQSSSFTTEKQLILSMALVRFVNGMADMNQKGVYARSVHSIAEEIGLPDWLVDLRHEATHANLPSQDTLRAGIKVALSWLQEEYWEAQVKLHRDSEKNLCSFIEKYLAVAAVRKTTKKNIGKQALKVQSMAEEVATFVGNNDLWAYLQDVLLKNDFSQDSDEDDTHESKSRGNHVSEDLIKIWLPLFKALDRELSDFITMFVFSALNQYSETNMAIRKRCLSWVFWLMKASTKNNPTFTSKLPWLTLLEVCMRNPNFLQRNIISLILNEATGISEIQKKKIMSLLDIFHKQNPVDRCPKESYDMKTIDQFQAQQETFDESTSPTNTLQDSGWSLDNSETKWHLISFGEILGCDEQSVDVLELPVFDDHTQCFNQNHRFENQDEEKMDEIESDNDSNTLNYSYCHSLHMQEELGSTQIEPEKLEIILF